jgi:hypothetical protein
MSPLELENNGKAGDPLIAKKPSQEDHFVTGLSKAQGNAGTGAARAILV